MEVYVLQSSVTIIIYVKISKLKYDYNFLPGIQVSWNI